MVDDAFDYLGGRCVPSERPSFGEFHRAHAEMNNSEFVMPRFVQVKLNLVNRSEPPNINLGNINMNKHEAKKGMTLADKNDEILRRLSSYKPQPVGEGLALLSSRADFEAVERRMQGQCGSYKLFEK